MALTNKIIENSDGSLTSVSSQTDKELRQIAQENALLKLDNTSQGKASYKGDSQFSHRVARIPMVVVEQMMREGIWGDQDRMREWLNKAENAPFRTTKGKV